MTVYVAEGGAIDWSPRLAARMILSGVQVGDKPWPRRRVARQVRRAFAHWWTWTTALPGEVFRDGPCDMLFQVAGGIGANRTVRPLAAEDLARGISFQNVEARACPFRWCRLELERETSWRADLRSRMGRECTRGLGRRRPRRRAPHRAGTQREVAQTRPRHLDGDGGTKAEA